MSHRRVLTAALLLTVAAGAASGCGEERQPRKNAWRPALPAGVSVLMSADAIRVDPQVIGAGQLDLMIANRTANGRPLVLVRSDGGEVALRTPMIAAGDATKAGVIVSPGSYELRSGSLRTTELTVGPERPSSQNQLQTP